MDRNAILHSVLLTSNIPTKAKSDLGLLIFFVACHANMQMLLFFVVVVDVDLFGKEHVTYLWMISGRTFSRHNIMLCALGMFRQTA